MTMSSDSIIPGGRMNQGEIIRRGNEVVRPVSENVNVERVLLALTNVFEGSPKVIGRDPDGRLRLSWMEGSATEDLIDPLGQDRLRLESVGSLLRNLHDSTKPIVHALEKFSDRFSDPSQDSEVLCHGDPGPGNVIFVDGVAKALIDWEFSAPGRRVWDLAFALRYWAPLRDPENTPSQPVIENFEERAQWILDGYQASRKLRIDCAEILCLNQEISAKNIVSILKSRGDETFNQWVAKGGLERIERDKIWLARESQLLITSISGMQSPRVR